MSDSEDYERIIEKFNQIQEEILNIGWKGILERYHPDTNTNRTDCFKIFQLYKEIFENMKKRLEIDTDYSWGTNKFVEEDKDNGK